MCAVKNRIQEQSWAGNTSKIQGKVWCQHPALPRKFPTFNPSDCSEVWDKRRQKSPCSLWIFGSWIKHAMMGMTLL